MDGGGGGAGVPLESGRQPLRLGDHDNAHSAEKDSIVYEGKVIPFLSLPRALRKKDADDQKRRFWSVIVLQGSSGVAAIGVDRLLGTANVLVRPLPPLAVAGVECAGGSCYREGELHPGVHPEWLLAT